MIHSPTRLVKSLSVRSEGSVLRYCVVIIMGGVKCLFLDFRTFQDVKRVLMCRILTVSPLILGPLDLGISTKISERVITEPHTRLKL